MLSAEETETVVQEPAIVQGLLGNSDLHLWEGAISGHASRLNWVAPSFGVTTA